MKSRPHRAPTLSNAAVPLERQLSAAADAVAAVLAGRSLTEALAQCASNLRPAAQALAFHVMRWLGAAQALRTLLVPRPPTPALEALLLTALALLWPEGGTPYAEHTLVDQAVAAARRRGVRAAPFVNAVLRRFLRERDVLVAAARRDEQALHNHPAWWVERLRRDWPDEVARLLQADQQHPPMTLRVHARRTDAAAYVQHLQAQDIAAVATGAHTVVLRSPRPVQALPGFADGLVSVQDAAAQLAAPLLLCGLGPGAAGLPRVLDACAAPGGKTAHLLELSDLDLLALDVDGERLGRVRDTLDRLGLRAELRVGDAAQPDAWWDGRLFDAILLDAPCSASGIVRRHPDVRWLRRASDIDALAQTQARLLDALWPLLRPGGCLLYCTCSVFKAEGQGQIDAFLQRCSGPRPRLDPASPGHLLPLPDNRSDAVGVPPADGFFYALLHKP